MALPWLDVAKVLLPSGVGLIGGRYAWRGGRFVAAVVRRVPGTLDKVDLIHKEVFPNGGSSMRDSMTRIEDSTCLNIALTRTLATISEAPVAMSDRAGRCIWVNERWTELTGLTNADAAGAGWVNAVHAEDRVRVVTGWAAAAAERSSYIGTFRFQHVLSERVTTVRCRAEPVVSATGTIAGYMATLTPAYET